MLKYINGERVYRYGDKRSGFTTRGPPQDYYQLRDACLKGGVLFEDPEFIDDLKGCEWRRPTEISKRPKFVVDGISRFDIIQGNLGDCWFLAAVANLTMYPELYQRVVPDDQDFDENYAGIFHFRFWQFGKWVDVVVDDRLPVENGKLKFMCSTTDEFWSPLLEKAFAKLNGSYKVLDGGWTSEAMQIFTGGIRQLDYINQMPFKTILQAYERGSLMGCAKTDIRGREALTFQNLVGSHAYSITKVATATTISKRIVNLLRIRNPWGNEIEWNGPWSDG
ncbi:calpain-1 catalytic subunit-like [Aethina tumida]|uniref:calpain-1 catalytic subunit-like n=1 Tax=Aethina tumida TaxID=116153 RepID=UPI00214831C1|nr:calpain-1 catalytic subunit-like [Aethina tumida]